MESTAKAWTIDIEQMDPDYDIAMALDEIELQLFEYNEPDLLELSIDTVRRMEASS